MVVQLPPESHTKPVTPEIDAGVIDDARARHRRERWAGAIVAALAIAAGLLFAFYGGGGAAAGGDHTHGKVPDTGSPQPPRPLAVVDHIAHITEFGLLAPGVGWAINDGDFYLTDDGGSRWDVLASNAWTLRGRSVAGLGLAGDLTAEMGPTSSPTARSLALGFINTRMSAPCAHPRISPAVGVLAITANAGRSWATHVMPQCDSPTSLSFVNARSGYAVLTYSMRDSTLIRTVDGGAHWKLVSRFSAPLAISFGSREDGLAIVTGNKMQPSGELYRTTDGGRSWRRERFCGAASEPTDTVYCGLPTSFGRRGVVLAVAQNLARARSETTYLYVTADAGRHWTRRRVPPLDSPEMPAFSAPNAKDLFLYSLNGVLHTSTDGGRSWSSIPEPRYRDIYQLQFISARYGWMLGARGFLYTLDGGHSWHQLAKN